MKFITRPFEQRVTNGCIRTTPECMNAIQNAIDNFGDFSRIIVNSTDNPYQEPAPTQPGNQTPRTPVNITPLPPIVPQPLPPTPRPLPPIPRPLPPPPPNRV
jgi:hypothetical protein